MADLPRTDERRRPTLRELIAREEMVLVPGCYDALGARLVEEADFPAVYMTGFGSSASRLGPDVHELDRRFAAQGGQITREESQRE